MQQNLYWTQNKSSHLQDIYGVWVRTKYKDAQFYLKDAININGEVKCMMQPPSTIL